MKTDARIVLVVLCLSMAAWLVAPAGAATLGPVVEGTFGTQLTINGPDLGAKKGKVVLSSALSSATLKIAKDDWTDTRIFATLEKALPPDIYDVVIYPQPYSTVPPIILHSAFTVKLPELVEFLPTSSGSPGDEITINGSFFGTKKGKVSIEGLSNGNLKKKNSKVTLWSMNAVTGVSELRFLVPKGLDPGTCTLTVTNKVGSASADFSPTPPPGTGADISSKGVMEKGSVVLNGTTYSVPSSTTIRVDDNPGTESDLKDGMVVKVRGKRFDDVSGTAEKIEAENEVQGRVETLDVLALPVVFEILNQVIYVDDLTVYSNFPAPNNVSSMADGQFVEVHGERDLNGNIRASRVELLAGVGSPDPENFEVKGIVSAKVGSVLTVGALTVDAAGATFFPPGVTINDITVGRLIEAKGSVFVGSTLTASIVQREDLEDAEFEPAEGDDFEVEGYVTGFTVHPGTFLVDDRTVRTTAGTLFRGGSSLDLMNDTKVEAEGHLNGNVLVSEKITFKRARVRIEATASAITGAGLVLQLAGGDSFGVLVTDLTDTSNATLPFTVGSRYEMRGYVSTTGNIVAERIDDANSGGGARDVFQAQVTARTGDVLTMLGISVDTSTVPSNEFRDVNDNPITRAAFLSAVLDKIVKVRDDDLNGTWDKAELEN